MKKQAEKIQGKLALRLLNLRKILIPWGLFPFLWFIQIICRYFQDLKTVSFAKSRIPFSIVFFVWVVVCFATVNHIQDAELLLIMSTGKIKFLCVLFCP